MLQFNTAKRKGYETNLQWLGMKNNKILYGITTKGDEVQINSHSDLKSWYTPTPDDSLFKSYTFNGNKTKKVMSKKQSQPIPENVIRPTPPKNVVPSTPPSNEVTISSNVTVSNIVETVFVLQMLRGNELLYEMEFEKEDDFNYRHGKLREKYPTYEFRKKTLRSIVSYEQL